MIRVGFILESHGWMGGVNYYRNLFSALNLLPARKIHPVIFVGTHVPDKILGNFQDAEIVRSTLLDVNTPGGFLRRVANKFTNRRDPLLKNLLARNKIDVLSHTGGFCKGGPIRTIGWIPDFQHMHLSQFFSKRECARRDADFHRIARDCDCVILSSEAAKSDLARFAPSALVKAKVLQFVPEIDDHLILKNLEELKQEYGFTSPYFYMPNQFWIHKNHKIVIEAMAYLKEQGINVTVLSTGNTNDYRHPDHFIHLMGRVNALGLADTFKVLGTIPYNDLISLMHHSVAIINPSLFEGWSSTVEEAKALDKTILLSNLPVHIEQNPSKGIFFDPANSLNLAEKMLSVLAGSVDQDSEDASIRLHDSYMSSRLVFAQKYQSLVEAVAE